MAYDPAWDMPQTNWLQQGSFESGEIPPAVDPDAGTQICIGPLAQEWLPVILGALDQLRNPSTWIVADDAHMDTTLRRVDRLREIIAVGEGCQLPTMIRLTALCVLQYSNDGGSTWVDATDWVDNFGNCVRSNIPPPVPVNPPDAPPSNEACNIATWLTQQVLQKAFQQRATDRTANNSVSASVANIISAVFGNTPFINFLTEAANYMVQTTDPETAADVAAASTDAGFAGDVLCAVFGAIQILGYVNAANFGTVASNIAAISYPAHSWAPTMLANFWTNLGLATIQQIQSEGTVTDGDCSACSGVEWCHYFDFTLNDGGWQLIPGQAGSWNASTGWTSDLVPGDPGHCEVYIYVDMGASHNITEMQVQWASNSGHTGSQPHEAGVQTAPGVAWACVGDIPFDHSDGLPYWQSTPALGCSARYPSIALIGASAGGGYVHVLGCQIRGTGVNPFGFGNCVVGP
jgi:hypothetical protein